MIIGVLGGIGSGKSTVARLLAGPQGRVLDADRMAHDVLETPRVHAALREWMGASAFAADGRVDRRAVARRVFERPADLERLEALIHPEVRRRILAEVDAFRGRMRPTIAAPPSAAEAESNERQATPQPGERHDGIGESEPADEGEEDELAVPEHERLLVLDVPLLLGTPLEPYCDLLVFVDASETTRRDRVRQRGWDADELARRESRQIDLEEKRRRARYVISNDGTLDATRRAVETLRSDLIGAARRRPDRAAVPDGPEAAEPAPLPPGEPSAPRGSGDRHEGAG